MDIYSRIAEISIGQIVVFLKCMELENYSKAAEALNYTPSMVSKTTRKMEEKLGLVLFVRHGGRVRPTGAARLESWNIAAAHKALRSPSSSPSASPSAKACRHTRAQWGR